MPARTKKSLQAAAQRMPGGIFFQSGFTDSISDPQDTNYEYDSPDTSDDDELWAFSIGDREETNTPPDLTYVSDSEAEDEGEVEVGVKRKAAGDTPGEDVSDSDDDEVGYEEVMALEALETAEKRWAKIFTRVSFKKSI